MAPRKIHLDLLDLAGRSWNNITPQDIERLTQVVQDLPMQGVAPSRYAITGVLRVDDVIGGFFVVEYNRDVLELDEQKNEQHVNRPEWAKTVFTLFPRIGKVLLQSRQYPRGLTADRVNTLFRTAIPSIMFSAQLGFITVAELTQQDVPDEQFVQVFDDAASRVEKIVVKDLRTNPSLEGLTYYNPQRDRNAIIGQSHDHDFSLLDRIELDVGEKNTDLRNVHIAKSAVRSGKNEEMRYFSADGEYHVLRRVIKDKYEIVVDEDADVIREEDLQRIAAQILEQYGLYRAEVEQPSQEDRPATLFDLMGDDHEQ